MDKSERGEGRGCVYVRDGWIDGWMDRRELMMRVRMKNEVWRGGGRVRRRQEAW